MLLSNTAIIAVAVAIGIIVAAVIRLIRRKGSIISSAVLALLLSAAAYAILILTIPEVVYLGPRERHTEYRAPFGYTDPAGERHDLRIGGKYIYNSLDEDAIIYPVIYGENDGRDVPAVIPAEELTEVTALPDRYFTNPDKSVESHASSKTVWYIDTPRKMYERRGMEMPDL